MAVKFTNLAQTILAASITDADPNLLLRAGDGAKFPVLGVGDWFPLAVTDASGNTEIMRVTGRAGDTLAVSRAQEGTPARAYIAGSFVELRMTKAAFDEVARSGAGGTLVFITINDTQALV